MEAENIINRSCRPVTERIKTFEDACNELGEGHPLVREWMMCGNNLSEDLDSYLRLRIICAALNDGWYPKLSVSEWCYYPRFCLYTAQEIEDMDEDEKKDKRMMNTSDYVTDYAGFAYAYSSCVHSHSRAYFGYRLCLKTAELATYCGKQFIELWADLNLQVNNK